MKDPLKKSGIEYDQIIRSIKNLASSRITIDEYVKKTIKQIVTKTRNEVLIDFKNFKKINNDIKISVINEAIRKRLKKIITTQGLKRS